jgi:hypothetical protein
MSLEDGNRALVEALNGRVGTHKREYRVETFGS